MASKLLQEGGSSLLQEGGSEIWLSAYDGPATGTATSSYKAAGFPWANTFSHDATGAAALLIMVTTVMAAAWDFTTCSYGGVAATKLFRRTGTQGTTWIYGLVGPATGSNTVSTQNTGQYGDFGVITAVNISGCHATVPFGQTVGGSDSTSLSLGITTTDVNRLLLSVISPYYHPTPTFGGSSQMAVWAETTNANMEQRGRSIECAAAGAYTQTATVGYNSVFGAMVEILPAGGGGAAAFTKIAGFGGLAGGGPLVGPTGLAG